MNPKKEVISQQVYEYIKTFNINRIEDARCGAFWGLNDVVFRKDSREKEIKPSDLTKIWDSTQRDTPYGIWLRSKAYSPGIIMHYYFSFTRMQTRRKYNFNYNLDTLLAKKLRVNEYYTYGRENYTGLVRERYLQYILAEEIVKEVGPVDTFTLNVLHDYYNMSGFAEYKNWMKKFYDESLALRVGHYGPGFSLTDRNGKEFTNEQLKGKVALLDFWFTGCTGCVSMTPALKKLEDKFSNDTNIVFVSISIDQDKQKWENSIRQAKYTTGTAINLYTGGEGESHQMIKRYQVTGYPELFLFDPTGKILANPVPNPRNKKGMEELTRLLENQTQKISARQHALANDGPYVFYNDNQPSAVSEVYLITNDTLRKHTGGSITVQTDIAGKTFELKLKPGLQPEPCVFDQPDALFALSDIEGNFDAFRKLLQANKIMNDRFEWTFGKGHLVFAGDMFDRGLQVTECLWLIYMLEEKAKAAGGYIHFVLGNHEIMNMQGEERFVRQKYKDNAYKIGKKLVELYNEDSELGRWLRTKNIIEKIGNFLFVHGGISPEIARMPVTIEDLNSIARPYYGGKLDSANQLVMTIYNSNDEKGQTSPFWFRGYFEDADKPHLIPTNKQLDSTMQKFDVRHIVAGHTIIADTITTWYNGKVINIDTHHASGKSEALLIEGNKYFRVNMEGEKFPLLDSHKDQLLANSK